MGTVPWGDGICEPFSRKQDALKGCGRRAAGGPAKRGGALDARGVDGLDAGVAAGRERDADGENEVAVGLGCATRHFRGLCALCLRK